VAQDCRRRGAPEAAEDDEDEEEDEEEDEAAVAMPVPVLICPAFEPCCQVS
jgi:hypothetical protein